MPSEKILQEKKVAVAALAEKLKNATAGVFVDYKGLSVQDDTAMRQELRKAGVEYSVIKNTLARFALKEAGLNGFDEILNGTTALALSNGDVVAPAKILCNFAKDHDCIKVKAGFIDGEFADAATVIELSKIPSKEELVAKTLYCFISPIQGLAIALKAIADKQSEGADAPATETVAAE